MTERKQSDRPQPSAREARAERLAAALKANLKRRKAQTRGREKGEGDEPPPKPGKRE